MAVILGGLVDEVYEGADAAVMYHVAAVSDADEVVVVDEFGADLDGGEGSGVGPEGVEDSFLAGGEGEEGPDGGGGGARGRRLLGEGVVVVRMSWGVRPGMVAGAARGGVVAVVDVRVAQRALVGRAWQRCLTRQGLQKACLGRQVQGTWRSSRMGSSSGAGGSSLRMAEALRRLMRRVLAKRRTPPRMVSFLWRFVMLRYLDLMALWRAGMSRRASRKVRVECAFAKEVVEGGSGGAVVECGAFEECGAGLLEGELAADVAGGGGRVDFGWWGGVFVVHVAASGLGAVGFLAWDGLGFAGVGVWRGGWWGGGACEGALCGVWLFWVVWRGRGCGVVWI